MSIRNKKLSNRRSVRRSTRSSVRRSNRRRIKKQIGGGRMNKAFMRRIGAYVGSAPSANVVSKPASPEGSSDNELSTLLTDSELSSLESDEADRFAPADEEKDDIDDEEKEIRKKWGDAEVDKIKRIIEGNGDAIKAYFSKPPLKKPATWGNAKDILLFFKYSPTSEKVIDSLNYMIKGAEKDDIDDEEKEFRKKWGDDEVDKIKQIIEGNEDAIKAKINKLYGLEKPATWGNAKDILLFFKHTPKSKEVIDTLNYMLKGVGRRFWSHEESGSDSSSWEPSDSSEVGNPGDTPATSATVRVERDGNGGFLILDEEKAKKDDAWRPVQNYVEANLTIITDYLNKSSILDAYTTTREVMNHYKVDGDELSHAKEAMSKLQKIVEEHKPSKGKMDKTWATKVNTKSHLIKGAIDVPDIKDPGVTSLNRDGFSTNTTGTLFDGNKIAELTQSFANQRKEQEEAALKLKDELSVAQSAAVTASLDTAKATAAAEAANETATKQAEEIKRLQELLKEKQAELGKRTMATIPEAEAEAAAAEQAEAEAQAAAQIVGDFYGPELKGLRTRLEEDQSAARSSLRSKLDAKMKTQTGESHASASKFSSNLTDLGSIKASGKLGPLTKTMGFNKKTKK